MEQPELFNKVIEWGRSKNLNDAKMQFAKINEEIGELAHELTRGNCGTDGVPSYETVDAIGDILVTVLIFSDIVGIESYFALGKAYEVIKDRKGATKDGSFVKDE